MTPKEKYIKLDKFLNFQIIQIVVDYLMSRSVQINRNFDIFINIKRRGVVPKRRQIEVTL